MAKERASHVSIPEQNLLGSPRMDVSAIWGRETGFTAVLALASSATGTSPSVTRELYKRSTRQIISPSPPQYVSECTECLLPCSFLARRVPSLFTSQLCACSHPDVTAGAHTRLCPSLLGQMLMLMLRHKAWGAACPGSAVGHSDASGRWREGGGLEAAPPKISLLSYAHHKRVNTERSRRTDLVLNLRTSRIWGCTL